MQELKIYVPTYNAGEFRAAPKSQKSTDFGDPRVPVVIREADGVRIVLGSHDFRNSDTPDVQIERRPGGWAIFLHPVGGSDASGYVYFLDDGRSFIVPEHGLGPTPAIVIRSWDDAVADVDHLKNASDSRDNNPEPCELCGNSLKGSGDEWDGLCPECADFVSSYLDRKGLTDEDREMAIDFLKIDPNRINSK
jgi:hypothetical protein